MGNLFLYVELNFSTHMQLHALFGRHVDSALVGHRLMTTNNKKRILMHVDSALVAIGHRLMTTNKKSNCVSNCKRIGNGKFVFVCGTKL